MEHIYPRKALINNKIINYDIKDDGVKFPPESAIVGTSLRLFLGTGIVHPENEVANTKAFHFWRSIDVSQIDALRKKLGGETKALINGEIVPYDFADTGENCGPETHIRDNVLRLYLGTGVIHSCHGVKQDGKRALHFFRLITLKDILICISMPLLPTR